MKKILLASILIVGSCLTSFGWGKTGHDAIAYIAECNLTKKAKKNVEHYLGNKSIVYYSTWMDEYRKTPEFKFTDKWHSGAVDENFQSTAESRKAEGDCVTELENAIERLKGYKELDDSTIMTNLKIVIHLAADMHCPVHVIYPDLKRFNVTINGKKMTYHAAWDSGLINASHYWNYTEYQHQLDRHSKQEKLEISSGTPAEWMNQSARDSYVIYEWASPDEALGKDFINKAHTLAETQITKAGYRLARILNDIFG